MPDYMEIPNVPNSYYNKARNFTLTIYAYRKLSDREIRGIAEFYRVNYCKGSFPRNKSHRFMFTSE